MPGGWNPPLARWSSRVSCSTSIARSCSVATIRFICGPSRSTSCATWFSTADGWSEPTCVGFPEGNEYGISLAADGTLYFMSDAPGGLGSADLYRSRLIDGRHATPENLGPAVLPDHSEESPLEFGCPLLLMLGEQIEKLGDVVPEATPGFVILERGR